MEALAPELCQKIFEDWVERPYIPLCQMLQYDLYKVCLFELSCHEGVPETQEHVRHWLSKTDTFFQFKRNVMDMVQLHKLSINVEAINEEEWMTYVPTSDVIVLQKYDWLRGGTLELEYDWFKQDETNLKAI